MGTREASYKMKKISKDLTEKITRQTTLIKVISTFISSELDVILVRTQTHVVIITIHKDSTSTLSEGAELLNMYMGLVVSMATLVRVNGRVDAFITVAG